MSFKKFLEWIEKNRKKTLIGFLIIFFITSFLIDISDFYAKNRLFQPIYNKIFSHEIEIEVTPFPYEHSGKKWNKIKVVNNGLTEIEQIRIQYIDYCISNESILAPINFIRLVRGESNYYEYESNRNVNCSASLDLPRLDFYRDERGRLYCNKTEKAIGDICLYCPINITVYSGFNIIKNVQFYLPFLKGSISTGIGSEDCLPLNSVKNISKLKLVQTTPRITVSDIGTMCLLNQFPQEWCKKYGALPKTIK